MGCSYRTFSMALIVATSATLASASLFDFLVKSNEHDGVMRVETLSSEQEVLKAPLAVVFVTAEKSAPRESERLAQLLSTRTILTKVYSAAEGLLNDSTNGQVLVYSGGRRFVYHGVREAALIMKFISNLESANLKTITGKLDKIAFDHMRGTKVVGYFTVVGSPEHQAFEQAASLFGTQVSFYTIMDPVVAKHLKMNTTGQIYLVREFDKHPVVCPVNPATLADIQQLIVRHRDSLVKVTPLNVLDPALTASSAILLVTDSSPLSFHLLKLVARTQQQVATITAPGPTAGSAVTPVTNNRVLWVEITDFVSFDAVSTSIHGLAKLPGLGFFDSTAQTVKWMDLLPLNGAPTDKIAEEANFLLVKAFLNAHPTVTAPSNTAEGSATGAKTEL